MKSSLNAGPTAHKPVALACVFLLLPACQGSRAQSPSDTVAPGADHSTEVGAGEALLQQQRYAEAMTHFEVALKANSENAVARRDEVNAATNLALARIRAKQPEQAMEVLERALSVLPNEPELLLDFGIEATTLQQFPLAQQALAAADHWRPRDPKTIYAMARLAMDSKHLDDAERNLKVYLELRPHDASAYFGLGRVYASEQKPAEARQALQRSIELQPQQTESFYELGQIDLDAHQDQEAGKYFQEVLNRSPAHAGALTGMGELALRAKDYAHAEQLLAAAEHSDPAYPTPHYFRGLALAKLGRADEAKEEMLRGDSRPHAGTQPGGGSAAPQP